MPGIALQYAIGVSPQPQAVSAILILTVRVKNSCSERDSYYPQITQQMSGGIWTSTVSGIVRQTFRCYMELPQDPKPFPCVLRRLQISQTAPGLVCLPAPQKCAGVLRNHWDTRSQPPAGRSQDSPATPHTSSSPGAKRWACDPFKECKPPPGSVTHLLGLLPQLPWQVSKPGGK